VRPAGFHLDPLDRAGERVVAGGVVVGHRRLAVAADVGGRVAYRLAGDGPGGRRQRG
jgi:hypothetical protein